jgi:hypothetical protein
MRRTLPAQILAATAALTLTAASQPPTQPTPSITHTTVCEPGNAFSRTTISASGLPPHSTLTVTGPGYVPAVQDLDNSTSMILGLSGRYRHDLTSTATGPSGTPSTIHQTTIPACH